jgi:hypothetical protein
MKCLRLCEGHDGTLETGPSIFKAGLCVIGLTPDVGRILLQRSPSKERQCIHSDTGPGPAHCRFWRVTPALIRSLSAMIVSAASTVPLRGALRLSSSASCFFKILIAFSSDNGQHAKKRRKRGFKKTHPCPAPHRDLQRSPGRSRTQSTSHAIPSRAPSSWPRSHQRSRDE